MGKWFVLVVFFPAWCVLSCSVVAVASNRLQEKPLTEGILFFGLLCGMIALVGGIGMALTAFPKQPEPARNGA